MTRYFPACPQCGLERGDSSFAWCRNCGYSPPLPPPRPPDAAARPAPPAALKATLGEALPEARPKAPAYEPPPHNSNKGVALSRRIDEPPVADPDWELYLAAHESPEHRRAVSTLNLLSESRFYEQRVQAADRRLRRILDRIDERLGWPEEFTEVYGRGGRKRKAS